MARFFIRRPIFAWVIALVVMLAGALSFSRLPVSQYPQIAPTTVRIGASYPGASAETIANSVTTPIENGLTGLTGLLYMSSSSQVGSSSVTLTFDDSIDPDIAQVQVQNKLQLVLAQLPDVVQQQGVTVTRSTSSILLVGALVSRDGRRDSLELGDVLERLVVTPVQRVPGVGSINSFSSGYAMRIWLDPVKMVKYQVTTSDVLSAVSAQNTNVSVGTLGAPPAVSGQQLTASITAQSQLRSAEDFDRILLRVTEAGSSVYLGDVARIGIGAESYGRSSRYNGLPAAGFGVNLAAGANAVETAKLVRAELASLAPSLPAGVEIAYPYDTSPFIQQSIARVYETLAEAVALVFLVILVFLQNWRATLIPTIAVPVVLLGTFAVLSAFGMSINTLTMFALVLAIGLLVDDAIVVVENVERIMRDEGLGPREATEKGMGQISGALVGIVTVLSAVFLPMAFLSGSTGVIYRQFSVTLISAMVLSLMMALILTPAMCATLLRPVHDANGRGPGRLFNRGLARLTGGYVALTSRLIGAPLRMLLVLAAVVAGIAWLYERLPSSFLPQEDQGVLMTIVQLPDGATDARTLAVVQEVEHYLLVERKDVVDSVFAALGFSFGGAGQNFAMIFSHLKPFADRPTQSAAAIAQAANMRFFGNRSGRVFFLQPPAIQGLGNTSGFSFYLLDQGGLGLEETWKAADRLVKQAAADGRLANLRGNEDVFDSTLHLVIDQQKAGAFGLSLSDVNSSLSVIFAGRQVNDFTLGTDLRPVIVQADAPYRMQPGDIDAWYARNSGGEMVPYSAFTARQWDTRASTVQHYGGTTAIQISGAAVPGVSTGTAMQIMSDLVSGLGDGFALAWTGISYQEELSGAQAPFLYAISVLVVFLSLAALYESWSVPIAVMLAVPVGVIGALAAAKGLGQSNDVYFKVGILATVGLAARNAILIVEFAQTLQTQGQALVEATLHAARQRLRPILMTTFAFMLGVLPLALASGAGAAAQRAIGIGVLGGMTATAVLGVFVVPAFYVLVVRVRDRLLGPRATRPA